MSGILRLDDYMDLYVDNDIYGSGNNVILKQIQGSTWTELRLTD